MKILNDAIDYSKVMSHSTASAKAEAFDAEAERVGYVALTDALLNLNEGGTLALKYLEDDEKLNMRMGTSQQFFIKCLHDAWGAVVEPGSFVVRSIQKPLRDRAGRKLRNNYVKDLKRRGTFDAKFLDIRKFKVDEHGCIKCGYEDAGWFLSEYGVSWENGSAITGRKELSSEPCKCPDGSLKHVRYWRYSEVLPEARKLMLEASSEDKEAESEVKPEAWKEMLGDKKAKKDKKDKK